MIESLKMNFDEVARVRSELKDDLPYLQFVLHKKNNPNYTWKQAQLDHKLQRHPMNSIWPYPEEWVASYWLYYDLNGEYFKDAEVLDIGSSFGLYSAWTVENGARHIDCVEPDLTSYQLCIAMADAKKLSDRISCYHDSVESFMPKYTGKSYDLVFLGDVFGYFEDGIGVFKWIKNTVGARYIVLETNVVDTDEPYTPGNIPSRKAMRDLIDSQGWKILSYYDYRDFVGRGIGAGAVAGLKEFYVLERM